MVSYLALNDLKLTCFVYFCDKNKKMNIFVFILREEEKGYKKSRDPLCFGSSG